MEKPDRSRTLCRIPSKFSKILWVRAGSFIVARFEEAALEHWHDAVATEEQKEECGELMAWLGEVEEEEPDDG